MEKFVFQEEVLQLVRTIIEPLNHLSIVLNKIRGLFRLLLLSIFFCVILKNFLWRLLKNFIFGFLSFQLFQKMDFNVAVFNLIQTELVAHQKQEN